jgi:hypothetical protein
MLHQNIRCGEVTVVVLKKTACAELLNRICHMTYAGDARRLSATESVLKTEVGLKLSKKI